MTYNRNSDDKKFPRGTMLAFESGEYSDFQCLGMLVTLRDLDLRELAQRMVGEELETREEGDRLGYKGFMGWLVSQGYAAPVDYSTVHLGDYGGVFDDDFEVTGQEL